MNRCNKRYISFLIILFFFFCSLLHVFLASCDLQRIFVNFGRVLVNIVATVLMRLSFFFFKFFDRFSAGDFFFMFFFFLFQECVQCFLWVYIFPLISL